MDVVKQRLEFKVLVEGYVHSVSNLEEFERRKNLFSLRFFPSPR